MGNLIYSIFRYKPSMVSGEIINLGAIFYYSQTKYREFYSISKWGRVLAFDDTLNIKLLKALMNDLRSSIGTSIDNIDFDIKKFCARYSGDFYFDKFISLYDIYENDISCQIEEIKKMYFQFEYEASLRPSNSQQKSFLRKLLFSKKIKFNTSDTVIGDYGDLITYDFTFGDYGVVFFNFNSEKIDNKTMNKVKAWAWNTQNCKKHLKLIVLYDLYDFNRKEVVPALEILRENSYKIININDGFSAIGDMLDDMYVN